MKTRSFFQKSTEKPARKRRLMGSHGKAKIAERVPNEPFTLVTWLGVISRWNGQLARWN